MIRASTQSARSRTSPRSPNSVARIRIFACGDVDVDGARGVSSGHGRCRDHGLTIGEDTEDNAAQRPGSFVDADGCLKPPIARLQLVGQESAALGAQPSFILVSSELKAMALDGLVGAKWAGWTEVGRRKTGRPACGPRDRRASRCGDRDGADRRAGTGRADRTEWSRRHGLSRSSRRSRPAASRRPA